MSRRFQSILVTAALLVCALAPAWAQPACYVVDLTKATPEERLVVTCLQGLANRNAEGPFVYGLTQPTDRQLLTWDQHLRPHSEEHITAGRLLDVLRPIAKGQILIDPGNTVALDVATSLAGVHDAIVAYSDHRLPIIADLRGRMRTATEAYKLAAREVLPRCSRESLALLGPGLEFRDYTIGKRLAVLPLPNLADQAAWRELVGIVSSYPAGAPIFAPPIEEAAPGLEGWAHRLGHPLVAAERAPNLSFRAHFARSAPPPQRARYVELAGKVYLCFIFTGGNDLAYAGGRLVEIWQNDSRGRIPLGWTLPLDLPELAPDIVQALAGDARRSSRDTFVLQLDQIGRMQAGLATALRPKLERLDIRTVVSGDLARARPTDAELMASLKRLTTELTLSGVFLPDRQGTATQLLNGAVVMTKGFSASSAEEILQRLGALQSGRGGLIFVRVDAAVLSPDDIARLIERLPSQFEVVGPEEFVHLTREVLAGRRQESPSAIVASLVVPAEATPAEAIAVRVTTDRPTPADAALVYRQDGGPAFMQPLAAQPDGSFAATLGPLLRGGAWTVEARLGLPDGTTTWSAPAVVKVAEADADGDGLSDVEETLYATDPARPDTEADGIPDGVDPFPLTKDTSRAIFFGPLRAADDAPYIADGGESVAEGDRRRATSGQSFCYRLRPAGLPPGGNADLALEADGPCAIAFSSDGVAFTADIVPQGVGRWRTAPIPRDVLAARQVFVRIACTGDATSELALSRIAISSPADAPSVASAVLTPPYPGPDMPVGVSARVWDPRGIKSVSCAFRAGRGTVTVPMARVGADTTWVGALGTFPNASHLDWWIVAENEDGTVTRSRLVHTWIGTLPGETISLFAGQELRGGWSAGEAGWGAARDAAEPGLEDAGEAELSGGSYDVWLLGGGRGRDVGLWVDGTRFASITPLTPDGWQRLGRLRLTPGTHRFRLVSGPGPTGASARYGQLLLTAMGSFRPPPGALGIANSLTLASPRPGARIGPRTLLSGSAAGNISRVELLVDGKLIRRVSSVPFSFIWDTARLSPGTHVLRMTGVGRAEQALAILEMEIEKAGDEPSPEPDGEGGS